MFAVFLKSFHKSQKHSSLQNYFLQHKTLHSDIELKFNVSLSISIYYIQDTRLHCTVWSIRISGISMEIVFKMIWIKVRMGKLK